MYKGVVDMGLFNNKNTNKDINIYVQNPLKPDVAPPKHTLIKSTPENIYVQNPHKPKVVDKTPKPIVNQPICDHETRTTKFRVAGLFYHLDALIDAATENDLYEWDDDELLETDEIKVYEYLFIGTVKLEQEPTNPYSNTAIKVLFNDKHIGYVPDKRSKSINELISSNRIVNVSHNIRGGKYKLVDEKYNYVENREHNYIATVIITYKV